MRKKLNMVSVLVFGLIFVFVSALAPCAGENGDSYWASSSNGLPTSGTYFGVAFGDLDNDGHLDIVAASDGNGLRVFLGDSAGNWAPVASHPATDGGYGDVAIGDYDKDGNMDIFAGSPGNSASSPTGLHVFKGDGAGGFTKITSTTLPTTGKWRGVAVGDVNNDGNLDLAATSGYGSSDGIHVYTGDGTGTFTDDSSGLPTGQSRESSVVLEDFNNDDNLDVAAGGSAGVSVYLGNGGSGGSMSWTDSSTGLPSSSYRYTGVKGADVDNDGSIDLVLSSYNAGSGTGMRAYRNVNNAASWTSISTGLPESGDYIELSAGDFDGDGNMDLVAGGVVSAHGIKVFHGDGAGSWTESPSDLPTTGDYVGNKVGDFNEDGNLDILFGRYGGGGLEVWENLGGDPSPPTVSSTSPNDDAQDVPLNTEISIKFSKAMNTGVTESAITSSPTISWSTSWTSGNTVVTLTPSENLELSTDYTITISTTAESADGLNIESSYQFSFTTGSVVDLTPPALVTTDPESDALDVDSQTTITITFSEPMDKTVTENAVSISHGEITEKTWDEDGTRLSLAVSLEHDTTYTVMISDNAQDLAGNKIASGHSFTFTTEKRNDPGDDVSEFSTMNVLLLLTLIIVVILILYMFLMKRKKKA